MAVSSWPNSSCSSREKLSCRSSCIRIIFHDRLRSSADSRRTSSKARRLAAHPVEARDADDEQQGAHQNQDLPLDAAVDRLVRLRGVFLHAVVEHEELRHHAHEFLVLRGGARAQRRGSRGFVVRPRLRERPVDERPEAAERSDEARLLRRGALGGCERLFRPDRLVEIRLDAIERLPPRHHRVRFGAVRHVAHGAAIVDRLFWIRSSCSESSRLRSLMCVCSSRSCPTSWTV